MKAIMFPGQGSQFPGMGKDLFLNFPEQVKMSNSVLGYDIEELCVNDPGSHLNQTQYTQPALYVVNHLSYLMYLRDGNTLPQFLLGHSLGEYNALLAAGSFDFETGLRLVQKRGELMSRAIGGGMAAVLNVTKDRVFEILNLNGLIDIDLANYNAPHQIVLSGPKSEMAKAESFFLQQPDCQFIPLNTSGAFHSRAMKGPEAEFAEFIRQFEFSEPSIPVIANATGKPYSGNIAETLASQISNSVLWLDSVGYILKAAFLAGNEVEFVESGAGFVLTRMVDHIKEYKLKESSALNASVSSVDENLSPEQQADLWNRNFPIGTSVRSTTHDYGELKTRTKALPLFGHRCAVYMEGYNGYFDTNELVVL